MNSQQTDQRGRSLGTRTKLAADGALLAGTSAAAAGVAIAVGPIDTSDGSQNEHEDAADHDAGDGPPHVPGLSIEADGFRIVPAVSSLAPDSATTYSFRIVDPGGVTVTDFDIDIAHERPAECAPAAEPAPVVLSKAPASR